RDGLLTVTFNGEVFNFIELRKELEDCGHHFHTRSDTEVVLRAYQHYGEQCVERFNGQWALGIWDRSRGRLFLSRDRMGVRPLYYTQVGRAFLFASEVKALLAHPEVSCELDPKGLNQVLTFWCPLAPTTVFRGIRELPPGHNLVLEGGRTSTTRYWSLNYSDEAESLGIDGCAERLLELLSDAARLRLRSDVPVGAYLSGGLDSSIITALIRSHTPRLQTFSVMFEEAEFDESRYQRQMVDWLGTDHTSVYCDSATIARVFPNVVLHAERPLLRSAPAPMYLLSQLVRASRLKVVLTGEGADEVLGGYDLFKEDKVRRFCVADPDSAARAALFGKLYPYMSNLQAQTPEWLRSFFGVRPEDLGRRFFAHMPRWTLTSQLKRLLSLEWAALVDRCDAEANLAAVLPPQYDAWRPFCRAQYVETALLMPGYILSSQGDRMAMAHGVEGRFPFLDHRVVEFA
ncbi:MAG: asparagine synthase (glutamine-hydrolyzing), partial [Patescibacteria group bacterium]|nr:asparagine synthase (glutamine-hydrolyzing) [Patescibacteria group bacterium]